jgi:hypothetical protein
MCMQRTCNSCRACPLSLIPFHPCPPLSASLTPPPEKATWWGCGNHISSVMDSIPEEERCTCAPKVEFQGKEYPPKQGTGQPAGA